MNEDKGDNLIYSLGGGQKILSEDDVRVIVSQQLRSIIFPTVVQSSYLQSGNFISGTSGWRLSPTTAEFQSVTIAGVVLTTKGSFGGDGTDGALTITAGTTTLDLGGATTYVKNYTSISITGTAVLAFSNPHANGTLVTLKSQGAVTVTSSASPTVDLRSLGAATDTVGITSMVWVTNKGGAGASGNPGAAGAGGTTVGNGGSLFIGGKIVPLACGAGGGTGGDSNNGDNRGGGGGGGASVITNGVAGTAGSGGAATAGTGGAGGRGGGTLYIECGGALNITAIFNASGANGSSGTHAHAGGGGGGGGGSIIIVYGSLTANSGTYTVTAGSGGAATPGTGGAGGAGSSLVVQNTFFA